MRKHPRKKSTGRASMKKNQPEKNVPTANKSITLTDERIEWLNNARPLMDKSIDYRLAELAGYKIYTVDVDGVTWTYPKVEGTGIYSFKYRPATDLRLLVECVRGIDSVKSVAFVYTPEVSVRCDLTWTSRGDEKAYVCTRATEEEALYACLQQCLERNT